MFWEEPFNLTEAVANCNDTWGVTPAQFKAQTEWGGRRIEAASNIVVGVASALDLPLLRLPWRPTPCRSHAGPLCPFTRTLTQPINR
jgi:hypothetical protein